MERVNLLEFDGAGLRSWLHDLGQKPFRATQLLRWVHRRGQARFDRMSDVAQALRTLLDQRAEVRAPTVIDSACSSDGTRKWLIDVGAGNAVESVFIPEDDRATLCISTQAGCAVNCRFCSTGRQGFNRNLSTAEIIGQLWLAEHTLRRGGEADGDAAPSPDRAGIPNDAEAGGAEARRKRRAGQGGPGCPVAPQRAISNVVLMGMGEPLQNYAAVLPALRLMLDQHAYGLSRRRVTLSTAGMVPQIDRLAADCPVALAVSLHAPTDALRDQLVPLNRKYPLRELMAACRRYLPHAPRDFITFEYVMLAAINDSEAQARELVALVADVPCKFNLIPFNPFPGSGLRGSAPERIRAFAAVLGAHGIVATTRKTRGGDISAACGQLAGEVQDRTGQTARIALHGIGQPGDAPDMPPGGLQHGRPATAPADATGRAQGGQRVVAH